MYLISCPAGYQLFFFVKGLSGCCYMQCGSGSSPDLTGGTSTTVPPTVTPFSSGLSDLAWSDVGLLIAALFTACCIAAGYHILSRLFYRG